MKINDDIETLEREKEKYCKIWSINNREYADFSPGLEISNKIDFLEFFKTNNVSTILDAGIGSGKLCKKMISMGFECHGLDIADNCLDEDLINIKENFLTIGTLWDGSLFKENQFDAIVCLDVLEHIPTQYIEKVIENLYRWTKKYLFLQIALLQDNFGLEIGEPLHLTVKPKAWWDTKFTAFKIIKAFVLKDSNNEDFYTFYLIEKL